MATLSAGYDLFSVVKGSTLFHLDPLFQGAGTLYSDGVPIDRETMGNFSTGLLRKGEIPDGESGVVPIEMFAEHSVSVSPVKLSPFGLGDGEADFHTIINLGGLLPNLPNTDGLVRPSQGVMAIRRSRPSGGRFEIMLNINPLIVLTRVGGSIADLEGPDVIQRIDGSGLLNPVTSIGGQWSEAPTKLAVQHQQFSAGNFWAAFDRTSGDPGTVELKSGGLGAERLVEGAIHPPNAREAS